MIKLNITKIIFLLSPLLSIPLILKDVYHNKMSGYVLAALIFALAGYFYQPSQTGDKAYYFELHEMFKTFNLDVFILYLATGKTDYVFYLIIFIFAKLGFTFPVTAAFITGTTVYLYLYLFRVNVIKFQLNKKTSFFFFIMIIATLSLPSLFSGMRFNLATAFVLWGLYKSIIEEKNINGILWLVLATLTHFSAVVFLPLIILYTLSKKNITLLKITFLFSFIFLFIPKEHLVQYLGFLDLNAVYLDKMNAYVVEQKSDVITNTGHLIYLVAYKMWYYLAGIYLLYNIVKIGKNNNYLNLMLMLYILLNIVDFSQTVFNRYALIAVFFFILLLMHDYAIYKKGHIFRIALLSFLIATTALDILVQRDNFSNSYMRFEVLTLPTIILTDPTGGKHFSKTGY